MLLKNSLEGGTNGQEITTDNSGGASGDAFSYTFGAVYTTAQAAHGTVSAAVASGSTGLELDLPLDGAANGDAYARVDFRIGQRTSGDEAVILVLAAFDDDRFYDWEAWVTLPASGSATLKLIHFDGETETTADTENITLPLSTWCRLEIRASNSTSSTAEGRFYNSADGTTVTATVSGSASHAAVVPWVSAPTSADTNATSANIWVDDLGASDTDWLGPVAASAVDKTGTDTGTLTDQANIAASLARTDTASLTEQTTIGLTRTDTATLAEQVAAAPTLTRTDTSQLDDQAAVAVAHGRDEQAALTEQATIAVTHTRSDGGTLAEGPLTVALTTSDPATLTELSDIDELFGPAVADHSTVGDQAHLTATLPLTDTAALAEQAAVEVLRYGTDTATLAETSLLTIPATDTATLTELATVTALLTATDTALLDELAQAIQPVSATDDTATLTEAATVITLGGDITRASPPYTSWAASTPYT